MATDTSSQDKQKQKLMRTIINNYGLTMDMCEKKISESHIQEISEGYCEKWRRLPCHLDMPPIIVKDIEHEMHKERDRRYSFLTQWEEAKGSDATYKKLIYSLLMINSRVDAEKICEMLCDENKLVLKKSKPFAEASIAATATGLSDKVESKSLSPGVISDLKQQLEMNYERIMDQYACYVSCIRNSLIKKGTSLEDLRTHLLNLSAFKYNHDSKELKLLSGRAVDFHKAKTINEIFEILSLECCSFLDFKIFQSIIKYYKLEGEEELKYPDFVKKYINDHNIGEFKSINPNLPKLSGKNTESLILKFDIALTTKLAKVMDLKVAIAKILGVKSSTLLLLDIEEGCVIVTIAIPAKVAEAISDHIFESKEMFEDLPILWIKFKKFTFKKGDDDEHVDVLPFSELAEHEYLSSQESTELADKLGQQPSSSQLLQDESDISAEPQLSSQPLPPSSQPFMKVSGESRQSSESLPPTECSSGQHELPSQLLQDESDISAEPQLLSQSLPPSCQPFMNVFGESRRSSKSLPSPTECSSGQLLQDELPSSQQISSSPITLRQPPTFVERESSLPSSQPTNIPLAELRQSSQPSELVTSVSSQPEH